MHKFLIYPLALSLGLASCASFGQQDWSAYLNAGYGFYTTVYCPANPQSDYCTPAAKQKAEDAKAAAEKAIAAYNAGTGDLAAMQKAIKAAFKLFADFKG